MFKITQRQFTGHLSCTGRVGGVQILDGYFALDGVGCPEYALSRGLEILWSQVQVLVGPPNSKASTTYEISNQVINDLEASL